MQASLTFRVMVISFTLCLALILTILPLPNWAFWLRPEWVMLVLIYWCLALPERISVGIAWFLGLLMDVLQGTLLGQHALALAVVAYFIVKFHPRIRLFPIWQKSLIVFFLSVIYLALIYWVQGMMGVTPKTWEYWLPALTTTLLWPWVFFIMRDLRRRFNIY